MNDKVEDTLKDDIRDSVAYSIDDKTGRVTYASVLACMMLVAIILSGTAFASSADALWSTISNLIQTWVTRLGGVIMFVGGVMFGLGWKSDDAEQKSRGISTIIAGAIIVAIAALTSQFFA